jgi:GC-rich sequence DNA-binding factor
MQLRGRMERTSSCSLLPQALPPSFLPCCLAEANPFFSFTPPPVSQAVQFRRFRQAVNLMHCVSCFEGVVSRPLLLQLAASRLAVGLCLPYVRGGLAVTSGDGYLLSVARLEAVAAAMPAKWFEAGAPREAAPLTEHVSALVRSVEAQRGDARRAALALRLARVVAHLGDRQRAGQLAAAFGQQL